jgi:DNA-binding PadR family transcriptional regulator
MLYHILALLWDDAADLDALVEQVAARTGAPVTPAVLDGHLWFLFQSGFIDATEGGRAHQPVYALTPRGSDLLAITAEQREFISAHSDQIPKEYHHVSL